MTTIHSHASTSNPSHGPQPTLVCAENRVFSASLRRWSSPDQVTDEESTVDDIRAAMRRPCEVCGEHEAQECPYRNRHGEAFWLCLACRRETEDDTLYLNGQLDEG